MSSIADFDQKKFIKEVRIFMKKHKLSCRIFAAMSSTSYVTLYRLEKGENQITFSTIKKLQKAMDDFKPSVS